MDATVAEGGERTQRLVDELEMAFAELSSALNLWIEAKVLFPQARDLLSGWCTTLNEQQCDQFQRKQLALAGEPQSSKHGKSNRDFNRPQIGKAQIEYINQMGAGSGGDEMPLLPSKLEEHLLAAISAIYDTFTAEHGREQVLGADDLFPIIFCAVKCSVSMMPALIEVLLRALDQSSKGAYYAITILSALQFITRQLESPSEDDEPQPEPEPELEEFQPAEALGVDAVASIEEDGQTHADDTDNGEQIFDAVVDSKVLGIHGKRCCVVRGKRACKTQRRNFPVHGQWS